MDWLIGDLNAVLDFYHYMFAPVGQPFYTGAFWSNEVQWIVAAIYVAVWHLIVEHRNQKRHEDLKKHITETLNNDSKETISRNA